MLRISRLCCSPCISELELVSSGDGFRFWSRLLCISDGKDGKGPSWVALLPFAIDTESCSGSVGCCAGLKLAEDSDWADADVWTSKRKIVAKEQTRLQCQQQAC